MSAELDAALGYLARGWPVFPCRHDGSPATPRGFHDATLDADRVRRYWERHPDAAIGIATGADSLAVLDIDHPDYEAGVADLPDCVTDGGPVVRSGGGKWHLYLASEGIGRRIRFSEHCDWLDGDGYVIAPPSVHKSGNRYAWFGDTEQLSLTKAPTVLLDRVRSPRLPPPSAPTPSPTTSSAASRRGRGRWSPAGLIGRVASAREGERNNVLCWAAHAVGADVRSGKVDRCDGDSACVELERVAIMVGLTEHEARRTIASGYGAGLDGRSNRAVPA